MKKMTPLSIAFAFAISASNVLAAKGKKPSSPIPCDRLILAQSAAIANASYPGAVSIGDSGVYLQPNLIVGVDGQRKHTVSPKLSLKYSDGRITSIESFTIEGKRKIVATSERDAGLAFFNYPGKMTSNHHHLHEREDSDWSPIIVARCDEAGFLVTAGGPSPFRVIDVKNETDAGVLQKPNSARQAQEKVWFLNQGANLLVLNADWTLSIYQLDNRRRRFAYSHDLELGLFTLTGFSKIESEILATELSMKNSQLWISHPEGVFRFSLARDLSAPDGILWANKWIQLYYPITAMELDPSEQWLWLASEEYPLFTTREKRLRTPPSKVDLIRVEARSGKIDTVVQGAAFGSRVRNLYVTSAAIALVSAAPESAIAFFNENGGLMKRWMLERSRDRWYLSHGSGPYDPIHSSTLSPSGQWLATGHDGGAIGLWNIERGMLVATVDTTITDLRGLAFSPDETELLVSGHLGHARVYSLKTLMGQPSVLGSFMEKQGRLPGPKR